MHIGLCLVAVGGVLATSGGSVPLELTGGALSGVVAARQLGPWTLASATGNTVGEDGGTCGVQLA